VPSDASVKAIEDAAAKKIERMGLKFQAYKESKYKSKSILHHDEIGMFIPLHRVLLRRYMALTPKALVIYKD
jgi:hypothetical protein